MYNDYGVLQSKMVRSRYRQVWPEVPGMHTAYGNMFSVVVQWLLVEFSEYKLIERFLILKLKSLILLLTQLFFIHSCCHGTSISQSHILFHMVYRVCYLLTRSCML